MIDKQVAVPRAADLGMRPADATITKHDVSVRWAPMVVTRWVSVTVLPSMCRHDTGDNDVSADSIGGRCQDPSQVRDLDLHRPGRPLTGVGAPHPLDQAVGSHNPIRFAEQQREHHLLLTPAAPHIDTIKCRGQRPE